MCSFLFSSFVNVKIIGVLLLYLNHQRMLDHVTQIENHIGYHKAGTLFYEVERKKDSFKIN